MEPKFRDDPFDPVEESTALIEKREAETRLSRAEESAVATAAVTTVWDGLISRVSAMYERNDYVRRLRPLYQGTNRHA